MERIKELRMTAIILLVGVFLLSGCFFSSKNEVTFKTNGGSEVKSASVKSGNKLEVPDVPTKEGYVFEGWYLNGKEYNFEDEVNEDITLVAKWRKVEVDDEEGNDEDDDNEKEEEPTTSATTKKVTKKTTTASGTVKKTTTKKTTTGQTETTTKKTTSSTTTNVPEEKPTEPIIPEKPSVPEEPSIPEEPTVPEVPEKKELKMNITITEENLDTMIVESKNDNVLDVIKSDGDVKVENPEEIKKKYNLVIDLNSEEVNTISNLSEEDLNSLLSSDVTKWKINDQKGKFLELDIKDDKISTSSDEAIEVIVLNNIDKAYVVIFDEKIEKWVIDYPSVMVKNGDDIMYYASLNDAIKGSLPGSIVTILKDIEIKDRVVIDKAITIDGGKFKITSSADYLFNIKGINDETREIVLANMEVKVKSLLLVEELKVKSITIENIAGSYEEKIMDNESWLEIVENNLKLDFLEIKEENTTSEKTL